MDTDQALDLQKAPEPLHKAETHEVIGCAFAVLNGLGHGLHEKLYENALCVEFRRRAASPTNSNAVSRCSISASTWASSSPTWSWTARASWTRRSSTASPTMRRGRC